jgi:DNA polymerase, archaea type
MLLHKGGIHIHLQIIDCSYGYSQNGSPVINLFGINEQGQSVVRKVRNFLPYFYCDRWNDAKDKEFKTMAEQSGIKVTTEQIEAFKPLGYQTKPHKFVKITTINPKDVRILREFVNSLKSNDYESDILFKNRYLIDKNIGGMSWVVVPNKALIDEDDVIPIQESKNAPLKIMTLDIECLPIGEGIPTPDVSPVILVSLAFDPPFLGRDTAVMVAKNIECPRKDVVPCSNEQDLLKRLSNVILEYDPDVIATYNGNSFDWAFLAGRAEVLNMKFPVTRDGRGPWVKNWMGNYTVSANGRIMLDMYPVIKAMPNIKVKNYKLATVAKEILHSEKHDVKPREMKELWEGPGIARFISYSRRDAVLVMQLLKETRVLDKFIALARASGALLQDVVDGGQSNMIESLLMRRFKAENRLVNRKPDAIEGTDIKGGFVMEPKKKGVSEKIIILDYKSLYPTIMIAHNLCYSTEVLDNSVDDSSVTIPPSGGKFVKPEIYKGIVPRILEELLAERTKIKKEMKACKDKSERDALDAKQYAMKILLNSIYGYSGYARARLFSPVITNAVTSYGRENILRSKEVVESENSIYEVIYQDTDSMFIQLNEEADVDMDHIKAIGTSIASKVTEDLPSPMELVFEAYAERVLFVAKKRYAMYRFEEKGGKWEGEIKVKGIETVRKDWCDLTSETMSRCLEMILKDGDYEGAVKHARGVINLVRNPKNDVLRKLVMSKTYTKTPDAYKNKQPHIQLIKKMKQRGVIKYVLGERVDFVITKPIRKDDLFVNCAEDPEYVIENHLQIDSEYYITKQLAPPLSRILNMREKDLMMDTRQKTLEWT